MLISMSKFVHIIPVGLKKDRLLESLKKCGHPFQKIYLVIAKNSEHEIYKVASEVEESLKAIAEVEKVFVSTADIYSIVLCLIEIIKKETKDGNTVLINASDSPKTVAIASYIAAQLSGIKLYMGLPKYEENEETGIKKVVEIVFPPLKKISNDKLTIIKVIKENGNVVNSINKLIELLEGKIKDSRKYMAQRARMSYHLKKLENDGLIKMIREGKNVKIMLTDLGKAYAMAIDT